jgi:hypothetical protein
MARFSVAAQYALKQKKVEVNTDSAIRFKCPNTGSAPN